MSFRMEALLSARVAGPMFSTSMTHLASRSGIGEAEFHGMAYLQGCLYGLQGRPVEANEILRWVVASKGCGWKDGMLPHAFLCLLLTSWDLDLQPLFSRCLN